MERNTRKGILAGGNWIIDFIKMIDIYPDENALANILDQNMGNGGAPFNVLKAIHKMGFSIPLEGVGVVGDDEIGEDILKQCKKMEIDTNQIKVLEGIRTSYTDVMTVRHTGKRTFFHYRGANALLEESDFDFTISQAKIFHLGYLLLLDRLDIVGSDGLSGAAKVFKKAKEAGFITSTDIVSEQSNRYNSIIPPSLPYLDLLFINEFEAKMLTGIKVFDTEGEFLISNGFEAAEAILKMGVSDWVIIHFPKGAIALNKNGQKILQPCINMPPEKVKGTVGAGDAFAAGVLAGLHEDWSMEKSLVLGVCVAAISLLDNTASGGIIPWQECLKFGESLGFKKDFLMSDY
jgi:sugar/nucleoside kinase (ribokinase family)